MPVDPIKIRQQLATAHTVTPYYEAAERAEALSLFWSDSSLFKRMFDRLDLTSVVELACGRGRHTAQILDVAGSVTVVDILPSNIDECRKRFSGRNVSCIVNSGNDLADIPSSSATALFSYDAMVHFEATDVLNYISETYRVLKRGGRALLHYSNNESNPEGIYSDGLEWRSFFSEKMMRHFSSRAGFTIVESCTISWPPSGPGPNIDAITLVEKPLPDKPDDAQ